MTSDLPNSNYYEIPFFAGQLPGVEGYIESTASGLVADLSMAQLLTTGEINPLPPTTATGALGHYISKTNPEQFQPQKITFGHLQG